MPIQVGWKEVRGEVYRVLWVPELQDYYLYPVKPNRLGGWL